MTDFKSYPDNVDTPLPDDTLSEEDASFLSEFLNPVYLQARTMKALAARFVEESSLELHSFLCAPLAEKLQTGLLELDDFEGLGMTRSTRIPSHNAGGEGAWQIKGPPHKWRYCALRPPESGARMSVSPRWAHTSVDEIVRSLQDELFPSPPFRAWLAGVSKLVPVRYAAEARRFRPGLDYTLATSEAKETRLDVVLGLTPQHVLQEDGVIGRPQTNGHRTVNGGADGEEKAPSAWSSGEWGGWEVRLLRQILACRYPLLIACRAVLHGASRRGRRSGGIPLRFPQNERRCTQRSNRAAGGRRHAWERGR